MHVLPSNSNDCQAAAVQAAVLDALRRRAAGEQLSDEQVIAARPELGELLRAELLKLQLICAAGLDVQNQAIDSETKDHRAVRTPNMMQLQCPHCREPFATTADTPVAEIICSICGGHFSLVGEDVATHNAPSLRALGHFELVERLGVGGFGTVWKARDRKLDRTVAIKIPRQGMLNNEDLEKFLREARAAAQLQHPNIVRVHEVGHDGESVFIVSDFVRGVALNDWITAQRPPLRRAVELCIAIATALQHAHDRGVIHRDLKPANILIDGDGQPHLMDFGLARRQVGEVTLTMEGQVLGTPAYMSPEQALGKAHAADNRTDIYSLGVILFELLTGELPFRGNARMIMHQVIHEEPTSPRRLDSRIPKDLETVSLKCLEKMKEKRYESAQALAADLGRFLRGEAIVAKAVGRVARSWLWAKRHPLPVGLVAALGLSLVVGFTASSVYAWRATKNAERALAERKLARSLVDDWFTSVSESRELKEAPGLQLLRRNLLERAKEYYAHAVQEPGVSTDVQNETATAYRRLGMIVYEIGTRDEALNYVEKAVELQQRLVQENPQVDKFASDNANSLVALGVLLRETGRRTEALTTFHSGIEIQSRLFLGNSVDIEYSRNLATSCNELGLLLREMGRLEEALESFNRALEIRDRIASENPGNIDFLCDRAACHNNLGLLLRDLGLHGQAVTSTETALAIYEQLVSDNPNVTKFASRLASTQYNLALLMRESKLDDEALKCYRMALEIQERLARENPSVINFASELANTLGNLGLMYRALGRSEEAMTSFQMALDIHLRLARENPMVAKFANNVARNYHNLGNTLRDMERAEEALASYQKALEIREQLVNENPNVPDWAAEFASSLRNFGSILRVLGRDEEALAPYQKAVETLEGLIHESSNLPRFAGTTMDSQLVLANVYLELQQAENAKRYLLRAEDTYGRIPNPQSKDMYNLACTQCLRASLVSNDSVESSVMLDTAMQTLRSAVELGYRDVSTIQDDEFLAPLQNRDEFKEFLDKLREDSASDKAEIEPSKPNKS